MNQQELKQLNEKLAKWLDLKDFKIYADHSGRYYKMQFINPQHNQLYIVSTAFHLSLDACFEYLVSKLEELNLMIEYRIDFDMKNWRSEPDTHYWGIFRGSHQLLGVGEAETPTLALCLAIEKLIDIRRE